MQGDPATHHIVSHASWRDH